MPFWEKKMEKPSSDERETILRARSFAKFIQDNQKVSCKNFISELVSELSGIVKFLFGSISRSVSRPILESKSLGGKQVIFMTVTLYPNYNKELSAIDEKLSDLASSFSKRIPFIISINYTTNSGQIVLFTGELKDLDATMAKVDWKKLQELKPDDERAPPVWTKSMTST